MTRWKRPIAAVLGVSSLLLGVFLRARAGVIISSAPLRATGSFAWTHDVMERLEAYHALGLGLMALGLAVLLTVLINWLWSRSEKDRPPEHRLPI